MAILRLEPAGMAIVPDIPTALIFNIPIAGGVASGTIAIPAGSNRTIAIRAYDAGGGETHSGSVTVSLQPGANPTIAIVLTPLTGDVPIEVTLDRKSTRLNSSHGYISYAVFCLKKKPPPDD